MPTTTPILTDLNNFHLPNLNWPWVILIIVIIFIIVFYRPICEILEELKKRITDSDSVTTQVGPQGVIISSQKNLTPPTDNKEGEATQPEKSKEDKIKEEIKQEDATDVSVKDLKMEMFFSFYDRELDKAEDFYKQLQNKETDSLKKLENEVLYFRFKFSFAGDTGAIKELERLSKNPDVAEFAYRSIGYCYESANDYVNALEQFKLALAQAKDDEEKNLDIILIARYNFKLGNKEIAYKSLADQINTQNEPKLLSDLYEELVTFYDEEKNYEMKAAVLEKAIQLKPNDSTLHFAAAYAYSQKNFNELSLMHYKIAHHFKPEEGGTSNNLALQYEELEMPIKAVEMYKKSFEQKETLAGANLAYRYMQAGFKHEAKDILDKALQEKNPHNNVAKAMADLGNYEEKENEKEKEIEEKAKIQQRLITLFSQNYFAKTTQIPDMAGVWLFEKGEKLDITSVNGKFEGVWQEKDEKFKMIFELSNNSAVVTKQNCLYTMSSDSVPIYFDVGKGFAYLENNNTILNIMINERKVIKIFKLTKVT